MHGNLTIIFSFMLKILSYFDCSLGDFSKMKPPKAEEYKKFVDWFSSQPHNHKILISGNRDNFMDTQTTLKVRNKLSLNNQNLHK